MARLKFTLSSHCKAGGSYAIRLRITKNGTAAYISTDNEICNPETNWDKSSGFAKKGMKNSASLNLNLSKYKNETEEKILELERKNPTITLNQIIDKINNRTPVELFSFMSAYVEMKKGSPAYYETLVARQRTIERFTNGRRTLLEDVDKRWLVTFKEWLIKEKYAEKTIGVQLALIRSVFWHAVDQGHITREQHPFRDLKVSVGAAKVKEPLTKEEVQSIRNTITSEKSDWWLFHTRKAWLFAYNIMGMRVGDVVTLQWSNIADDRIMFTMRKSKDYINLQLPDEAIEFINFYKQPNSKPSDYIFPFMAKIDTMKVNPLMHRRIKYATKMMNTSLEKLASMNSITKNLTTHSARHSFAQRGLDAGVPVKDIGLALGHYDERTTNNYLSRGFNTGRLDSINRKAHATG